MSAECDKCGADLVIVPRGGFACEVCDLESQLLAIKNDVKKAHEAIVSLGHNYHCDYLIPIEFGKISRPCNCGAGVALALLEPWVN